MQEKNTISECITCYECQKEYSVQCISPIFSRQGLLHDLLFFRRYPPTCTIFQSIHPSSTDIITNGLFQQFFSGFIKKFLVYFESSGEWMVWCGGIGEVMVGGRICRMQDGINNLHIAKLYKNMYTLPLLAKGIGF